VRLDPSPKHYEAFLHLSANPAKGKGAACFGDSGGPILLGDTDIVLGVHSWQHNINCAGITEAFRVDTEKAHDFIDQFLS
jgi:secreted trypsin-like serine protease